MTTTDVKLSAREQYEALTIQIAKVKEQMTKTGEEYIKTASAEVFNKFPEVESFSWNQYTPYFNDGEACEFSANTDYFDVELTNGDRWEDVTSWCSYRNDEPTREDELGNELSELFGIIDQDTLETLFGDHVTVTVSRAGVELEEYDHD